ncbi:hypothetical protein FB451DRAFT_1033107, partial [Mycena latifolia]
MLIWIKGALSPQEIREKLLNADGEFQKAMVSYLESAHVGEFLTGTMAEVKSKVPYFHTARKGLHDVMQDEIRTAVPVRYVDPTQTVPKPPPPLCENCDQMHCPSCENLTQWWGEDRDRVDDLVLRSNGHDCRHPLAGTDLSKPLRPGARVRQEVKGCLRKDGSCRARFPRDIFLKTEIDADGHINMKKHEAMINTITPAVTYTLGCNTDVTSLLSGTSIKAIVAYISDYVTKPSLKFYHIFDTVKDIINKHTENIGGSMQSKKNTKNLVMQMVNSLTSKLQIGSPMASLYLLEKPDHYTNRDFKVLPWKTYVSEIAKSWCEEPSEGAGTSAWFEDECEPNGDTRETDKDDRVLLQRSDGEYVGTTNMDDYIYRPSIFAHTSLYEFFQMTSRKKRTKKQKQQFLASLADRPLDSEQLYEQLDKPTPDDEDWLHNDLEEDNADKEIGDRSDAVSMHPFMPRHDLYKTHYIRCDRRDLEQVVPNFVGGSLPRMDQGDCEYYCMTMLTLFKPWRSGEDLKNEVDNWDETFREYKFSPKALEKMKYFNIKYECLDARDDFSAMEKKRQRAMPLFSRYLADISDEDGMPVEYDYAEDEEPVSLETKIKGPKWVAMEDKMEEAEKVMQRSGWTKYMNITGIDISRFIPEVRLTGPQWKNRVIIVKDAALATKVKHAPDKLKPRRQVKEPDSTGKVLLLDSFYFTKYFKAKEKKAMKAVESIIEEFELKAEQERAFRLVANHA